MCFSSLIRLLEREFNKKKESFRKNYFSADLSSKSISMKISLSQREKNHRVLQIFLKKYSNTISSCLSCAQCPIHFSSDRSNRRYFCGGFRHAIGRRGSIQCFCGRILVSLSRFSLDNHQLRLSGVSIKARI